MVNKCVVFGCTSGYLSNADKKIPAFTFPHGKPELLEKWTKFVNRVNWTPSKNSVICMKHFEEEFILKGLRKTLNWSLNPLPTIHSDIVKNKQSLIPTIDSIRKPPKRRKMQEDELPNFISMDTIKNFEDLEEVKCCPSGFHFKKTDEYVFIYRIHFDAETHFPTIKECIRVDKNLHVQLQCDGNPIPLPKWFVKGHNSKLTKYSMLENFPQYIINTIEEHPHSIHTNYRSDNIINQRVDHHFLPK